MSDLQLSSGSSYAPDEITDKEKIKKKRGCGCFLMGCFIVFLLCALPVIGGFVYLATLKDSDYGHLAMSVLKNEDFAKGIKEAIQESGDMSEQDKAAFVMLYDTLVAKYDSLPADKREAVDRDLVVVVRKAIANPDGFGKEPPQELLDIMTTLGIGTNLPSATTPMATTPTPSNTPAPIDSQGTPKNQDPYSFDLPAANKPQVDDNMEDSKYDF